MSVATMSAGEIMNSNKCMHDQAAADHFTLVKDKPSDILRNIDVNTLTNNSVSNCVKQLRAVILRPICIENGSDAKSFKVIATDLNTITSEHFSTPYVNSHNITAYTQSVTEDSDTVINNVWGLSTTNVITLSSKLERRAYPLHKREEVEHKYDEFNAMYKYKQVPKTLQETDTNISNTSMSEQTKCKHVSNETTISLTTKKEKVISKQETSNTKFHGKRLTETSERNVSDNKVNSNVNNNSNCTNVELASVHSTFTNSTEDISSKENIHRNDIINDDNSSKNNYNSNSTNNISNKENNDNHNFIENYNNNNNNNHISITTDVLQENQSKLVENNTSITIPEQIDSALVEPATIAINTAGNTESCLLSAFDVMKSAAAKRIRGVELEANNDAQTKTKTKRRKTENIAKQESKVTKRQKAKEEELKSTKSLAKLARASAKGKVKVATSSNLFDDDDDDDNGDDDNNNNDIDDDNNSYEEDTNRNEDKLKRNLEQLEMNKKNISNSSVSVKTSAGTLRKNVYKSGNDNDKSNDNDYSLTGNEEKEDLYTTEESSHEDHFNASSNCYTHDIRMEEFSETNGNTDRSSKAEKNEHSVNDDIILCDETIPSVFRPPTPAIKEKKSTNALSNDGDGNKKLKVNDSKSGDSKQQLTLQSFFTPALLTFQQEYKREEQTEMKVINGEYICRDVIVYRSVKTNDVISEDDFHKRSNAIISCDNTATTSS